MSRVAVIIPTWNGRHLLEWSLAAVARQDEPDLEVLVVDNGSEDGTVGWLAATQSAVAVLRLAENSGFAAAVNAGIAATTAPHLLVLNNDAAPEPSYARLLADALEARPQAGACQGRILRHDDPSVVDSLGIGFDRHLRAFQIASGRRDPGPGEARAVPGVSATAALYRRRALEQVADDGVPPACFDPGFFAYYEDVDLALRLAAAGWTAWLVPDAACAHLGSATGVEGSWRKTFLLGRNGLLYLVRHRRLLGRAGLAGAVGARLARRALTGLRHPRRDLALTAGELAALSRLPSAWIKGRAPAGSRRHPDPPRA